MVDSALERAAASAAGALGRWVRSHDRFVVIGLLFSLLPLPPACFAGLLISLANAWLLRSGSLPLGEARSIRLALLLGTVNSALAVWGMFWISGHLQGLPVLGAASLIPDLAHQLGNSLLDLLTPTTPPPDPGAI